MTIGELFTHLESKTISGLDLVEQALGQPRVINTLVEGLFAQDVRVQYECSGLLGLVSLAAPAKLYPHFNSLQDAAAGPDKVLGADARRILGHVARVDTQQKFDPSL
ncbi:MAG: hypothetical protein KIS85_05475 [Anaerolineales bacterium]|nr:hypothetical protein [Anaerolineales bacterium]